MTNLDGDIWAVGIDAVKYTKVIFTRMDPAKPELDWSSKWNQTADLDIGAYNCYKITGWGSSTSEGTWMEI